MVFKHFTSLHLLAIEGFSVSAIKYKLPCLYQHFIVTSGVHFFLAYGNLVLASILFNK